MSINKRLFLFAAYDKDGIVDNALLYYLRQLSILGDIIIYMDNDSPESELDKLKKYTIASFAKRHGEYDFGSYKRAYLYAKELNILKNYDFIYLVNDSVFGPMFNISKLLNQMESKKTDAVGLIESKHKTHRFMESWFIMLNQKIFLSNWFNKFLSSVQKENDKSIITVKYEHGLTKIIEQNKCSWDCIYSVYGRKTYNKPKQLFKQGCPFIKKVSFIRHNGSIGNQIKYIFHHSDKDAVQNIIITANRLYGEKYMKWFLTYNPIKIFWRNITYFKTKIQNGGI
nr:hypothetical protein [Candidatus Enterousia merdequi]